MDESCRYQIKVGNGVDEGALNLASPLQVRVVRAERGATVLVTRTDQAGLIGLLRYLHQQVYVLLSAIRETKEEGRCLQI